MTPGVVSYCRASAKMPAIPAIADEIGSSQHNSFVHVCCGSLPMPETKSGTMEARVMMNNWIFLRRVLQFCGSRGESVG